MLPHAALRLKQGFGRLIRTATDRGAVILDRRIHDRGYPRPPAHLEITCRVDGSERQRSRGAAMVFGVPALIAYVTRVMTMEPGDLIATGTPAGVGPLEAGCTVEVSLEGHSTVRNRVVAEATGAQARRATR
jgi:2-keto-4-pentenoate hydratase/2-oxohepta-3-ene-1,7-dioic acid hydratase in catechol pathway